jgi:hypothetical protein
LIAPAVVPLVFRANQSRDVPWMPAEREHDAHDDAPRSRPQQKIIGILEE